jgi:glycosyltransferase involved in cell wall biosynthesis
VKAMNKGLLGLAMIARNSSETIARALESVSHYCSQLVVIDTGSNDVTTNIAHQFGAEVFSFPWNDSFADARNYSLTKMRTDWILILDTDEELQNINTNILKQANEDVGGFTVNICNSLSDNCEEDYTNHRYTRIFRNGMGFRFRGRIHEQIRDSIEMNGYQILDSLINIKHYGYSKKDPQKLERNLKLLLLDYAENPDDHFISYHLAQTYFAQGENHKSKEIFSLIFNSNHLTQYQRDFARLRIAQSLLLEDEYKSIITLCEIPCSDLELEGLRKFILGATYLSRGDLQKAYEFYNSEEVFNSGMTDKTLLQKVLPILDEAVGKGAK